MEPFISKGRGAGMWDSWYAPHGLHWDIGNNQPVREVRHQPGGDASGVSLVEISTEVFQVWGMNLV